MRSKADYIEIFDKLNPGFFDREDLKDMKEDRIFAELVMDLKKELPVTDPVPCPEGIVLNNEPLRCSFQEITERQI